MKKLWGSLPFRLLLGVVLGIVLGQFAGTAVMNVVVTAKYIIGQLINFCVPLIIIGFIAPSITKWAATPRVCWALPFCALTCPRFLRRCCQWGRGMR